MAKRAVKRARIGDPAESYGYIDYYKLEEKFVRAPVYRRIPSRLEVAPWSSKDDVPPYIHDAHDAIYTEGGDEIVIAHGWDRRYPIFAVDASDFKTVRWKFDALAAFGQTSQAKALDYYPDKDRVLALVEYDNINNYWGVIELEDGKIVRGPLHTLSIGDIRDSLWPTAAGIAYSVVDPDNKIWIAVPNRHVVVRTDWNGNVDKQFGVWNTPGSDDSHLNTPTGVIPDHALGNEFCVISDRGNHRVLEVKADMTINYKCPWPFPTIRRLTSSHYAVFWGNTWFWGGDYQDTFVFTWAQLCAPEYMIWTHTNHIAENPWKPGRILYGFGGTVEEYDINFFRYATPPPRTHRVWNTQSAPANTPIYSFPIVDYYRPNKLINLKATQSGDVTVEVPRIVNPWGTWDGSWETYLSESISANTFKPIPIMAPLGIFRIKVTLTADGTVDCWVNLSP